MIRVVKDLLLVASLILAAQSTFANTADSALLRHLSEAQKHLLATEKEVGDQRLQLARQLNQLEQEVLTLREQTSVARRLADEKTLSLAQLETRLKTWQAQQTYQQNLLQQFLQRHGDAPESIELAAQIAAAGVISDRLEQQFTPVWRREDVVNSEGEIASRATLSMGPVTWYWDEKRARAGLASRGESSLLQSDLLLDSADSASLNETRNGKSGLIVFDPSLSGTLIRHPAAESLIEHVAKGGLWVAPILLFGLFALAVALFKVAQFWRLPKLVRFTPAAVASALAIPGVPLPPKIEGMQRALLDIALNAVSSQQRDDQLFMQLQDDRSRLERWIGSIAVVAAISPLLGLLGTVSGMIETFKMMTLFGSGDPEVVSGGIAQALVTTELGLVVAIPALVLNAVLSRRARSYYSELESFAVLISQYNESDESKEAATLGQTQQTVGKNTTFDGIRPRQGMPA